MPKFTTIDGQEIDVSEIDHIMKFAPEKLAFSEMTPIEQQAFVNGQLVYYTPQNCPSCGHRIDPGYSPES